MERATVIKARRTELQKYPIYVLKEYAKRIGCIVLGSKNIVNTIINREIKIARDKHEADKRRPYSETKTDSHYLR